MNVINLFADSYSPEHPFLHVADELDSYMYQTVGHQAIDLYAEAMDLPLYRRTIQGSSLDTSKNYTKTDGDEVEDLFELLLLVKVGREYVVYGLLGLITLISAYTRP